MRLARSSERPNLPWHFTVVDEPAVNAFALPGGQIYITRGILAFLHDEEQLAGVLGHEIGHVTARHSAQQYTKATGAGVGLTLLSIFVPEARPLQGAANPRSVCSSSNTDATTSCRRTGSARDYTARTGWDPARCRRDADDTAAARRGERRKPRRAQLALDPSCARRSRAADHALHPGESNRRRHERRASDRTRISQRYVDGIIFGDSPSDGIVRGNQFLHPELRLGITFPQGWDDPQQRHRGARQGAGPRQLHAAAARAGRARQPAADRAGRRWPTPDSASCRVSRRT